MNKFMLTMNMPSRNGHDVHQIIAGHAAKSLEEFVSKLEEKEFVIVEEFYYDGQDKSKFFSRGDIAINYRYIGKIKMSAG